MATNSDMTLRIHRKGWMRLFWAFAISLALHLAGYGSYEAGQRFGWWRNLRFPSWVRSGMMLTELLKKNSPPKEEEKTVELPLVFVDVSSAQASPEPPKQTPFYSDKNSEAANPDSKVDTDKPMIDGKQTDIVKTEDVPREKAFPLQPSIPAQQPPAQEKPEQPKPDQVESKPQQADTSGDLAMAKPADTPQIGTPRIDDTPTAPPPKPRTIKEALAQLGISDVRPGEKMKQDGGVKRRRVSSSLDVLGTTFGAYDAKIIYAVQNRWDELLSNRLYARDRFGKVTVQFVLHANGAVTEMKILENTVDLSLALLCQSAIRDNAPYDPWPDEMRRKIGTEFREVTFTFYYN